MMTTKRLVWLTSAVAMSAILGGCATPPPPPPPPAPPPVVDVKPEEPPVSVSRVDQVESDANNATTTAPENLTAVERRFAEGLTLYNDGNYNGAIRIFREPAFGRAWPELRNRSMKYLAFSYCVANNVSQCRRTFVQLLKLEPEFELAATESGHPIWGPVFKDAQAEAAKQAARSTGKAGKATK